MRWNMVAVVLVGLSVAAMAEPRPVPGMLSAEDLEDFEQLDPARQRLVRVGLEEASRLNLNRYLYGSADPKRGGFDCSGVVFYLLEMIS